MDVDLAGSSFAKGSIFRSGGRRSNWFRRRESDWLERRGARAAETTETGQRAGARAEVGDDWFEPRPPRTHLSGLGFSCLKFSDVERDERERNVEKKENRKKNY